PRRPPPPPPPPLHDDDDHFDDQHDNLQGHHHYDHHGPTQPVRQWHGRAGGRVRFGYDERDARGLLLGDVHLPPGNPGVPARSGRVRHRRDVQRRQRR